MKTVTNNLKSRSKSGFFIAMSCPGCGGELHLEDNFFVLRCEHCDSVHRVSTPESPGAYIVPPRIDSAKARFAADRYLKEKNLPLTENDTQIKKIYYPYWKIDAVMLRLRKSKMKVVVREGEQYHDDLTHDKIMTDLNLSPYSTSISAGIKFDGIPATLGMRTEYIKLFAYASDKIEKDFYPYPVTKSWEEMRTNLYQHLSAIGSVDVNEFGENKTELFAPKAALVYFPFYILEDFNPSGYNRLVVDAVSGRLLNRVTEVDFDNSSVDENIPSITFGELKVEPHRCWNCGEDLPAEQSYLYICRNCEAVNSIENSGLPQPKIFSVSSTDTNTDFYLPFWKMAIPEDLQPLLRPIFGGIYNSDTVLMPAFKAGNFDALYRLTKRVSAAYPKFNQSEIAKTDPRFVSVNLNIAEAVMYTDIFVRRDGLSKNSHKAVDFSFQPQSADLVYIPFHRENYFLVDSVINAITVEKRIISAFLGN